MFFLKKVILNLYNVGVRYMINTDIVIIDSGIDKSHSYFKNIENDINGIGIFENKETNTLFFCDNYFDDIGHGTAISYIIMKKLVDVNIYMIKIFEKEFYTDLKKLKAALVYVLNNINCKIVHISNGYTQWDDTGEIYDLCEQLCQKGIIIVSAYNNEGKISYPAYFPCVIGVDSDASCHHTEEYIFVEDEHINIKSVLFMQRLPWSNNITREVSGNSFSSPYITCIIFELMKKRVLGFSNILNELKANAKRIVKKHFNTSESFPNNSLEMNKAIMFPLNKEIISLSRFAPLLDFKIEGIYDLKYLRNINSDCNGFIVKNYEKIQWDDDFDTFIMGHMESINKLIKHDLQKELIEKCIYLKKNIFSFDDISNILTEINMDDYNGNIYYPCITNENVPTNRFGKLFEISKPILGVFGTSSKQGKFTLQMEIKKRFNISNYTVGVLGTEPQALLCGFEFCYPLGYNSNVNLNSYQAILCLNQMMHEMEKKDFDILMCGSQSQTLHHNIGNLAMYPAYQYEFIVGTAPDAIVLCVNYEDEIDYIQKTIAYIESISGSSVIALVLFPFKKYSEWSIISEHYIEIELSELLEKKLDLSKKLSKNVYLLNDDNDLDDLFEDIVNYFGE